MTSNRMNHLSDQVIRDLKEKVNSDSLSTETFCILPFSHLSTTTIGEIRLCCRSETIGHIKSENLATVWKSETMNQIRKDLIEGVKRDECKRCWTDEENGIVSLRKGQNIARASSYAENLKDHLSGKTPSLPTLELKLSNRCNLRCLMCSPAASTKWMKAWSKVRPIYREGYSEWVDRVIEDNNLESSSSLDLFLSNPEFIEEFTKAVQDIRMLDFAGGEPLIDPLHYRILRRVIDHGVPNETTLRYSTNLTVLEFEKLNILELWSHFKEVHLTISIDGSRELNAFIRSGTKHDDLEANIKEVKKLPQVNMLKGTTTLSALNCLFIDETIEYILGDLGLTWHTSRLTSPDFLDARIWDLAQRELAIKKVDSLNLNRIHLDPLMRDLSQRHIDDYKKWMSMSFTPPTRALERLEDFCQKIDPNGFAWFREKVISQGFHWSPQNISPVSEQ
jgi:MoaA/NifB/PqqE/SkfB family radical SAM enzyme